MFNAKNRLKFPLAIICLSIPNFAYSQMGETAQGLVYSPTDFRSVAVINHISTMGNIQDGVAVAEPNEFTGVLASDNCSAALIGPEVLLTAAHCVDKRFNGIAEDVTVRLGTDSLAINYECLMHPKYTDPNYATVNFEGEDGRIVRRSHHDIALCKLKDSSPGINPKEDNIEFEVLGWREFPAKDDAVLIVGYGCSQINYKEVSFDDNGFSLYQATFKDNPPEFDDGLFRKGTNIITHSDHNNKTKPYFEATTYYMDTQSAKICAGDSGGPVFINATENSANSRRRIVGVNSHIITTPPSRITEKYKVEITNVYARMTSEFSDELLTAFLQKFSYPKICGIGPKDLESGCRK